MPAQSDPDGLSLPNLACARVWTDLAQRAMPMCTHAVRTHPHVTCMCVFRCVRVWNLDQRAFVETLFGHQECACACDVRYVHADAHVHACAYVHVDAHERGHVHMHMCMHMNVDMYTRRDMCMRRHAQIHAYWRPHTCTPAYVCTCIHVRVLHLHPNGFVCACASVLVHVCACALVRVHACVRM